MDILKKYTHGEVSSVADVPPKKEKPSAADIEKENILKMEAEMRKLEAMIKEKEILEAVTN